MFIYAVGALIVGGIAWALTRKPQFSKTGTVFPVPPMPTQSQPPPAASLGPDNLVNVVDLDGVTWEVTRNYVDGPVGIGEAADLAKQAGMQLPTPALVDAIWRAADLKLLPLPRKNEVSQAVFDDQKRRISEQIGDREFQLVAGQFKDVVTVNGFPQLYGWHVEDGRNVGIPLHKPVTPGPGKVIQPPSGKAHGLFFKDYSQGVRLVRRVG